MRLLATPEKEMVKEKMNLDAAASIRSAGTVSLRLTGDSED